MEPVTDHNNIEEETVTPHENNFKWDCSKDVKDISEDESQNVTSRNPDKSSNIDLKDTTDEDIVFISEVRPKSALAKCRFQSQKGSHQNMCKTETVIYIDSEDDEPQSVEGNTKGNYENFEEANLEERNGIVKAPVGNSLSQTVIDNTESPPANSVNSSSKDTISVDKSVPAVCFSNDVDDSIDLHNVSLKDTNNEDQVSPINEMESENACNNSDLEFANPQDVSFKEGNKTADEILISNCEPQTVIGCNGVASDSSQGVVEGAGVENEIESDPQSGVGINEDEAMESQRNAANDDKERKAVHKRCKRILVPFNTDPKTSLVIPELGDQKPFDINSKKAEVGGTSTPNILICQRERVGCNKPLEKEQYKKLRQRFVKRVFPNLSKLMENIVSPVKVNTKNDTSTPSTQSVTTASEYNSLKLSRDKSDIGKKSKKEINMGIATETSWVLLPQYKENFKYHLVKGHLKWFKEILKTVTQTIPYEDYNKSYTFIDFAKLTVLESKVSVIFHKHEKEFCKCKSACTCSQLSASYLFPKIPKIFSSYIESVDDLRHKLCQSPMFLYDAAKDSWQKPLKRAGKMVDQNMIHWSGILYLRKQWAHDLGPNTADIHGATVKAMLSKTFGMTVAQVTEAVCSSLFMPVCPEITEFVENTLKTTVTIMSYQELREISGRQIDGEEVVKEDDRNELVTKSRFVPILPKTLPLSKIQSNSVAVGAQCHLQTFVPATTASETASWPFLTTNQFNKIKKLSEELKSSNANEATSYPSPASEELKSSNANEATSYPSLASEDLKSSNANETTSYPSPASEELKSSNANEATSYPSPASEESKSSNANEATSYASPASEELKSSNANEATSYPSPASIPEKVKSEKKQKNDHLSDNGKILKKCVVKKKSRKMASKLNLDDPAERERLFLPLKMGWVRELVWRKISDHARGDIYYHPLVGRKLRSRVEVEHHLKEHDIQDLTIDNFSYHPEPFGFGLPYENERDAFYCPRFCQKKEKPSPTKSKGKITYDEIRAGVAADSVKQVKKGEKEITADVAADSVKQVKKKKKEMTAGVAADSVKQVKKEEKEMTVGVAADSVKPVKKKKKEMTAGVAADCVKQVSKKKKEMKAGVAADSVKPVKKKKKEMTAGVAADSVKQVKKKKKEMTAGVAADSVKQVRKKKKEMTAGVAANSVKPVKKKKKKITTSDIVSSRHKLYEDNSITDVDDLSISNEIGETTGYEDWISDEKKLVTKLSNNGATSTSHLGAVDKLGNSNIARPVPMSMNADIVQECASDGNVSDSGLENRTFSLSNANNQIEKCGRYDDLEFAVEVCYVKDENNYDISEVPQNNKPKVTDISGNDDRRYSFKVDNESQEVSDLSQKDVYTTKKVKKRSMFGPKCHKIKMMNLQAKRKLQGKTVTSDDSDNSEINNDKDSNGDGTAKRRKTASSRKTSGNYRNLSNYDHGTSDDVVIVEDSDDDNTGVPVITSVKGGKEVEAEFVNCDEEPLHLWEMIPFDAIKRTNKTESSFVFPRVQAGKIRVKSFASIAADKEEPMKKQTVQPTSFSDSIPHHVMINTQNSNASPSISPNPVSLMTDSASSTTTGSLPKFAMQIATSSNNNIPMCQTGILSSQQGASGNGLVKFIPVNIIQNTPPPNLAFFPTNVVSNAAINRFPLQQTANQNLSVSSGLQLQQNHVLYSLSSQKNSSQNSQHNSNSGKSMSHPKSICRISNSRPTDQAVNSGQFVDTGSPLPFTTLYQVNNNPVLNRFPNVIDSRTPQTDKTFRIAVPIQPKPIQNHSNIGNMPLQMISGIRYSNPLLGQRISEPGGKNNPVIKPHHLGIYKSMPNIIRTTITIPKPSVASSSTGNTCVQK